MAINVREFLGRSAKPALLFTLWAWCAFSTLGQVKVETPLQTNDKIQQLAALNSSAPQGIPVGIDDLIHIDVFDVPELSRDIRVSDAGDISLPLIPGRVSVAGLSVFQLQERLAQLLIDNGLVSHPQVSVFVKERNSQPVSVIGAVNHPMVYQVVRPTTLLEILAAAGGITDDAGSQINISRPAQRGVPEIQPPARRATQKLVSK